MFAVSTDKKEPSVFALFKKNGIDAADFATSPITTIDCMRCPSPGP
jgi:hypothetical protein